MHHLIVHLYSTVIRSEIISVIRTKIFQNLWSYTVKLYLGPNQMTHTFTRLCMFFWESVSLNNLFLLVNNDKFHLLPISILIVHFHLNVIYVNISHLFLGMILIEAIMAMAAV